MVIAPPPMGRPTPTLHHSSLAASGMCTLCVALLLSMRIEHTRRQTKRRYSVTGLQSPLSCCSTSTCLSTQTKKHRQKVLLDKKQHMRPDNAHLDSLGPQRAEATFWQAHLGKGVGALHAIFLATVSITLSWQQVAAAPACQRHESLVLK